MWQYVAIAIIGVLVVIYLLDKLFPCLFHRKKNASENTKPANPCDSCPGCILHPRNKEKP